MIDARRMEVYTAFFDRNNQQVIDTKAEIVDENSFADLLAGHKIYFFGNGSDKVRMLLTAPNAHLDVYKRQLCSVILRYRAISPTSFQRLSNARRSTLVRPVVPSTRLARVTL